MDLSNNTSNSTHDLKLKPKEQPTKEASQAQPTAGPSGGFKLTLRKDLFEEIPRLMSPNSKKIDKNAEIISNIDENMESSVNDSTQPLLSPPNVVGGLPSETVTAVPNLSHDECNGNKLREVVISTPPGKLMFPTYLSSYSPVIYDKYATPSILFLYQRIASFGNWNYWKGFYLIVYIITSRPAIPSHLTLLII